MSVDKELGLSIFYILFGSIFIIGGFQYPVGTLENMGSGYWPILVGGLLFVIGVLNYIRSIGTSSIVEIKVKVPLTVAGLFILTYLLTKYIGFLFAVSVLIWGSAMLHPKFNWKGVAIVNIVCIIITVILKFTLLRNLPL